MERNILGVDIQRVSTVQEARLGTKARVDDTTYIYIKAGGTALTAGWFVYINPANDFLAGPLTTANVGSSPMAVGCAQSNIPANSFGWIAVEGSFTGFVGANCVAAAKLYTTGTNGLVDDTATTLVTGVIVVSTVGVSNANSLCYASVPMTVNCI